MSSTIADIYKDLISLWSELRGYRTKPSELYLFVLEYCDKTITKTTPTDVLLEAKNSVINICKQSEELIEKSRMLSRTSQAISDFYNNITWLRLIYTSVKAIKAGVFSLYYISKSVDVSENIRAHAGLNFTTMYDDLNKFIVKTCDVLTAAENLFESMQKNNIV